MKIMFNCMNLKKGGAERVISILANTFCKENEVMIVTNMYCSKEYEFDKNIQFKSLVNKNNNSIIRKIRRISPFMLIRLKKIITNYNPDVIISFLPEPNFRLLFLKKTSKRIKNIPTIISVRNDPNTEYKKKMYHHIMKRLYPLADQMVLQTEDAKKYFIDNINYSGVVIPNPVDDKFIVDRYNGIREKRIVAVGRLEQQKNYFNMIDAFKIVNEKHSEYILDIYGDGKLKCDLQKYIDNNKLTNKVFLRGKVDNIEERLYKASLFVMSSNYEGMPNSLLEANCLGVPCISTNCPCGGPKDILDNEKCGILVEVGNSKELGEKINYLIDNPKKAEELAKNAQKKSNRYLKNEIVKQWLQEIKRIMDDNIL